MLKDIEERILIERYAANLPEKEALQLLSDLNSSTIQDSSTNCRRMFDIAGYVRPLNGGQHAFNVEGKVLDKDGADVSVVLYADKNNRLLELEFIRWDGEKVVGLQWNTLQIYTSN